MVQRRSYKPGVISKDSPLLAIISAHLHPPKRRKIRYRAYVIAHLIWRDSSFWRCRPISKKDGFFVKWMKQNGFNPKSFYSLEAWHLMTESALKEYNANHKQFIDMHDKLVREGHTGMVPHLKVTTYEE